MLLSLAMGSLHWHTRCGWCGRLGAGYIPDGEPMCQPMCGGPDPRRGVRNERYPGCLWATYSREEYFARSLRQVFCGFRETACSAMVRAAVGCVAKNLGTFL